MLKDEICKRCAARLSKDTSNMSWDIKTSLLLAVEMFDSDITYESVLESIIDLEEDVANLKGWDDCVGEFAIAPDIIIIAIYNSYKYNDEAPVAIKRLTTVLQQEVLTNKSVTKSSMLNAIVGVRMLFELGDF